MTRAELNIGTDVISCLKADLNTEYEVRDALKKRHQIVRRSSRLRYPRFDGCPTEDTEEGHAHWLEQQLRLIELVGEGNYYQSQL